MSAAGDALACDFEAHVALVEEQDFCNHRAAQGIAWSEGPRGFKARKRLARQEPPGVYGVVAEFANEAPILMEAEGESSSHDSAGERAEKLRNSNRVIRTCVVRLIYDSGNKLLLMDMERMQK